MERRVLLVMLLFCLIILPTAFAYSADDFFVELQENRGDLTFGEAVFVIRNPLGVPISVNASSLGVEYIVASGRQIASTEFFAESSETFSIPDYAAICTNTTVEINGTSFLQANCSDQQIGSHNVTTQTFKPFDIISLQPNETKRIKLRTSWPAQLGPTAREWIPLLTVGGQTYRQVRWAWWNTSWLAKRQVDITNNNVSLSHYAYELKLNSSTLNYSRINLNGTDIRVVDATESAALNFYIDYFNQTIDQNTSIWVNLTNNTGSFWIYYGNPSITTSTMNGDAVFDLAFDDFEDGDTSEWIVIGGHNFLLRNFTAPPLLGRTHVLFNSTAASYNPTRINFTTQNSNYMAIDFFAARADHINVIMCASANTGECWRGFQHQWIFNKYGYHNASTSVDLNDYLNGTWNHYRHIYNLTGATKKFDAYFSNPNGTFQFKSATQALARENTNVFFVGLTQFAPPTGTMYLDNYKVYRALASYPSFTIGPEEHQTNCTGTLATTLISPAGNIEVQQDRTFTLQINVTCTSGCCGMVTGTADPQPLDQPADITSREETQKINDQFWSRIATILSWPLSLMAMV